MEKEAVAEKIESPNIREIAASLESKEVERLLLLEPGVLYSTMDFARIFQVQAHPVYKIQTFFRKLGLLEKKEKGGERDAADGGKVYHVLTETGVKVQEYLRSEEDPSSQLSPEVDIVQLSPELKEFFLKLSPDRELRSTVKIVEELHVPYSIAYSSLTNLVEKGLVDPPEKIPVSVDGKTTNQNFYRLSEPGIRYHEFLQDNPDGDVVSVSPLQKAEACIKVESNWFRRWLLATVWEVLQERAEELGEEEEEEEVGEIDLCLSTHITTLMREDGADKSNQTAQKIYAAIRALAESGILTTTTYDKNKHADMPLYEKEGAAEYTLKNAKVISIATKEMREFIRRVCEGEYGGFREAEKKAPPPGKKSLLAESAEILRASREREAAMKLRRDEAHEKTELSEGALKIYSFLLAREEPHAYPRKALVRDFGDEALEWIEELVQAGNAEVGAGGIVKIIRKLPKEVRVA